MFDDWLQSTEYHPISYPQTITERNNFVSQIDEIKGDNLKICFKTKNGKSEKVHRILFA